MFIHQCTNIAKHVVREYIELIDQEKQQDEKKSRQTRLTMPNGTITICAIWHKW